MKKLILITLAFVGIVSAAANNWNGYGDTAICWLSSTNKCITKAFILTDFDYCRIVTAFKDTANDDFASDSTEFFYGYQTGSVIYNASGNADTAWDDEITIDTVKASYLGVTQTGYLDSSFALTRHYLDIDTLSVSGYAYQTRNFSPEWDVLIRFWYKGLSYNRTGSKIKIVANYMRRIYENMRAR